MFFPNSLWIIRRARACLWRQFLFNLLPLRGLWHHFCQLVLFHAYDSRPDRGPRGFHVCLWLDIARPGYRQLDWATNRRDHVRHFINVSLIPDVLKYSPDDNL